MDLSASVLRRLAIIKFVSVGYGDGHDHRLSIWDCSLTAEPSANLGVRRPGSEEIEHLPTELGEDMNRTRQIITESAQLIFGN